MTIQTEVRPTEVQVAPKVKTVGDVLRHAALIIEERGWCQGQLQDPAGRVCVWGGIGVAATGNPAGDGILDEGAYGALGRYVGGSGAAFNDQPGRTAAEVTAALRAAAEEADRV